MNEDLLNKLTALLRKTTDNGCTQAEAEAALAAAQRLAVKNNLDLAEVQRSAASRDKAKASIEATHDDAEGKKSDKRRPHHKHVYQVLQQCFDVRVVYYSNSSRITIVGEKTDVAIAKFCWAWLDTLYPQMYRAYTHERGIAYSQQDNGLIRRSFFEGLTRGIIEGNLRVKKEAEVAGGNAYAMVLVDKNAVIDAKMAELFKKLRKVKTRTQKLDPHAFLKGQAKGSTVKLGHVLNA